jgi:DNA-binding winged helix-turn-helix (wHTH) protein/tetratricopeptide (TPR) repeat protein
MRRILHDDGRELFLEPRVMQVLVALVRANGSILTHDDLTASCWQGRFVSIDAINRVLSALRHTAGDLGAGVFTIETLRKVGYRLVRTHEASLSGEASAAQDEAKDRRSSRWGGVTAWHALAAMALLIGVLVAVALVFPRPGRAVGQGDQVLVASFINHTRDTGLGEAVAEAISVDLSQSRLVRVVDDHAVAAALERMKRPPTTPLSAPLARELAQREGIAAVIEGKVSALGTATLVSARLVSAKDGTVLAASQERARRPEDLIDAVDTISTDLRNKIGESLQVLRAEPPLEQVTTSSLPALKLYTQAIRTEAEGDQAKMIAQLEQALELDSGFAMAWRDLGYAVYNLGREPARAAAAFTQAYRHRNRLTERERGVTVATYFLNVEQDPRKALAPLEAVVAAYPKDTWALADLSLVAAVLQDLDRATELQERVVAGDPRRVNGHYNLFLSHLYAGDLAEAERVQRAAAKLFPRNSGLAFLPAMLASGRGDYVAAERSVLAARREHPGDPQIQYEAARYLATFAIAQGRLTHASRWTAEMVSRDESQGLTATALTNRIWLASNYALYGKIQEGRALIDNSLSRYPLSSMAPAERPYWSLAEAYALLGGAAEARATLARAKAEGAVPPIEYLYGLNDRIAGLIAMADGRPAEAAQRLHAASRVGQCLPCVLLDLGRARQAAGDPRGALETYQRYVRYPYEEKTEPGLVYERLSELYERAGDRRQSIDYARRLLALWKDADPELQPRLNAARTRIAVLSGS